MKLLGRDIETKILEQFYCSNQAEFLAIYGRRRVGKTYLIKSFFKQKECVFFNVTGTKEGSYQDQIVHFTQRIGEVFLNNIIPESQVNWRGTFNLLKNAIDHVDKNKKIVIFMDELPWLATKRSKLLQMIDYYWNQYWSTDNRTKLVVCGSSASWIISNIIHNKGGLHNRVTCTIHLKPFTLSQTKKFLFENDVRLNNEHILKLYFMMGGIPFYLTKIEKGFSASQMIESLLAAPQSFFVDEFGKLFSSLFDNSEAYIKTVQLLADHREGLGERVLLAYLGKNFIGAKGKKILNDLEQTGFIMSFIPLYHQRQGKYYRLIDEYVLFYLQWIGPVKSELEKGALDSSYWQVLQETPEWYSWQGYAFESACYKHILNIKKALKLQPTALSSTWRYVPRKSEKQRGAQIDLLFDRKDNAISICEIKYTKEPFVITKDYFELLCHKIALFKERTQTPKQIFFVLISANGIKENAYSKKIVHNLLTQEDLFEIHASTLI